MNLICILNSHSFSFVFHISILHCRTFQCRGVQHVDFFNLSLPEVKWLCSQLFLSKILFTRAKKNSKEETRTKQFFEFWLELLNGLKSQLDSECFEKEHKIERQNFQLNFKSSTFVLPHIFNLHYASFKKGCSVTHESINQYHLPIL
jgi:hypothetical protein